MQQKLRNRLLLLFILFFTLNKFYFAGSEFTIARLKYSGGGDWYNDPSLIPNFAKNIQKNTNINISSKEKVVSIEDEDLFSYPFLFATGHGNIKFSDPEIARLRVYLANGGFLYVDDDYGMDKYFRQEVKKIFPDNELIELPFSHPIYHLVYDFPQGLPKIHEHYPGRPQGFGIFHEGRLVLFYTYNTNISDGWVSPEVYNDPPAIREKAFEMGINIITYALLY
ncbi:MAG: DUF4159 domain-containing protein [bacterium]|nr:DUF4159 domain-containing protein [bacterium]